LERVTPASPSLPSVGQTALGIAAIRAAESIRSDRLFSDPFAAGFVRAANYVTPVAPTPHTEGEVGVCRRLTYWVAARTRFLDNVVMKAANDGCRQVVIVAAGFEARAPVP
jgi:methyltransferase (TIGR00027 family)